MKKSLITLDFTKGVIELDFRLTTTTNKTVLKGLALIIEALLNRYTTDRKLQKGMIEGIMYRLQEMVEGLYEDFN